MSESMEQMLETQLKILDKLNHAPAARQTDQSETTGKLAAGLAQAQGKFTNPDRKKTAKVKGKTRTGEPIEYSYKYADLADILSVVRAPLSEAGVSYSQDVRYDKSNEEAVVATTLRHESGEWVRSVLRFPAPAGKIQELGSVFTYLRRYSLSALIGIAPEEDDDAQLAVEAARHDKNRKAGKADRSEGGDMPTEEQLADFWASWKDLAATRFASKDQATAWLKDLDPNPNKANLGKLRSIINRLKLLKPLEGQADQAPPARAGDGKKPAAKGKDAKPKLTPEEQRRQAIQGRWSILVGDKFKGVADKELATATACWWAAEHYGWKRDPETEEVDGKLQPTRPRATLSAVEDIQRAVDGLKDLSTDELEEMVRDYLGWMHDRMLELNEPAEGAQ